LFIWVPPLRIFVEKFHVRVGRSGVQIVIQFLDVLSMISLMAGDTEQTFFQDRILAVPEGKSKTDTLMIVRNTSDAVLAPPVCTGTSLFMREVTPGITIRGIILANCSL
jgi:hypothetical protein